MFCNACGKKIETDAYISPTGKPYCCEQHYKDCRNMWQMVFRFIEDSKALREERVLWGNDCYKVTCFLYGNKDRIEKAMSKQFVSQSAKARYFSAIIKNGIRDYILPPPDIIKKADNEYYESKYKPKQRRKCIIDYIEGLMMNEEISKWS